MSNVTLHPARALRARISGFGFVIAILAIAGCATITGDPVVVTAERTISESVDVFDTFVHVERDNEAYLLKVNPEIHKQAENVRKHALTEWIPSARRAKDAYKLNRTAANKASLQTWTAFLTTTLTEVQTYISQTNKPAP